MQAIVVIKKNYAKILNYNQGYYNQGYIFLYENMLIISCALRKYIK